MLSYSNSISCSSNENKNEFILTFRQVHPVVDLKGNITETAEELVSEIVLNRDVALGLKLMLDRFLTSAESNE